MNSQDFSVATCPNYERVKRWRFVVESTATLGRALATRQRPHIPTIPLFVRLASLMFVFFALLIITVELDSRISPSPTMIDRPQDLFPDKREFLQPDQCDSPHEGYYVCHLSRNGNEIEVTFDAILQTTVYTFVAMPNMTVGNLIVDWGTPTGYSRSDNAVTVYWGTRAAQLGIHSFEPKSPVMKIEYGDIPKPLQPWRGSAEQTFSSDSHVDRTCLAHLICKWNL